MPDGTIDFVQAYVEPNVSPIPRSPIYDHSLFIFPLLNSAVKAKALVLALTAQTNEVLVQEPFACCIDWCDKT